MGNQPHEEQRFFHCISVSQTGNEEEKDPSHITLAINSRFAEMALFLELRFDLGKLFCILKSLQLTMYISLCLKVSHVSPLSKTLVECFPDIY